jgi:hypothetical protein
MRLADFPLKQTSFRPKWIEPKSFLWRLCRPTLSRWVTVEYRSDAGQSRRVTLVFPAQADISANKVSILTPIGAALIGLSTGQLIMDRPGRQGA